jgi:hypothetical protein
VLVVYPDRTAEDHQKIAGPGLRQRKARRGCNDALDLEASFPKRRLQGTKVLKGQVAKYEGAA